MARLVEMGDLEERCIRRADLEEDDHISHEEWLALISEVYGELFGVVADTGGRYFEAVETLTSDGTNILPSPPADIQSQMGLWYVPASGPRRPLKIITPFELEQWGHRTGAFATRYELLDNSIRVYPRPPSGQSYELRFIPQAPDLTGFASDDCVDVVCAEGESFLLWGVTALAKTKREEEDGARFALQRQDFYRERLRDWAISRTMTEPRQIRVEHDVDLPIDPAAWWYP